MYSFVAVEATLSLPILLSVYIMIAGYTKSSKLGYLFPRSFFSLPFSCCFRTPSNVYTAYKSVPWPILNKIALLIHLRPVHVIYFYCSATNFLFGSVVFCQGGTVLCLLLNVSLIMTPVFYYKPFPWWGNVSLSLFCRLFSYVYKGPLLSLLEAKPLRRDKRLGLLDNSPRAALTYIVGCQRRHTCNHFSPFRVVRGGLQNLLVRIICSCPILCTIVLARITMRKYPPNHMILIFILLSWSRKYSRILRPNDCV